MFKAIILDMDGLMVDTERLYIRCNREIAHSYGKELGDATLVRMIGRAPVESMGIFAGDLGIEEDPAKLVARREAMMLELYRRELEPMAGLMELLEWARGRFKLAIATGSSRRMVDEVVRRLGLEGVFEVIQTAEGLERGKPDPEIYRRAAAGLGLEASECVVMEDSSNGVKSGKAAGCHVIAVPNADTRTQDFSAADFVAEGLREAGWRVRGLCAGA